MTTKTPAQLKTAFETGDVPTQQDYIDVFDSYLNLVITGTQNIASSIIIAGSVKAVSVSAGSLHITNGIDASQVSASAINSNLINSSLVSASAINTNILNVQQVSASAINAQTVSASTINANTVNVVNTLNASLVSASVINVTSIINSNAVSAQTIQCSAFLYSVDTSVTAEGTSQGTARLLTADQNRVYKASSDSNNGVLLPNRAGRCIKLYNDTNANLKVYPPSGRAINDLGNNNAYAVSASVAVAFNDLGTFIFSFTGGLV